MTSSDSRIGPDGKVRERKPKTMTPAKAQAAVDAILVCLECTDLDGSDRVALEDARAALSSFEEN